MKKGHRPNSSLISHLPYHYHYSIVALLAALVYSNSLKADFVYDDRPAILTNDDVLGHTPWRSIVTTSDFWGNPIGLEGSHKSFRPLITASFRLQFVVHGMKAELFHGVNLIVHVINSVLVLSMTRNLNIMSDDSSLLSACLFACHPVNSEAVCSIVGRADLMATTFILLAITSHISCPNTIRTIALSVLAVFSKETGIILIPLVILYEFLFKNTSTKKFCREIANYILALCVICYLRLSINNFQSPKFSRNDNPIAHDTSFIRRALTFLYLPIFHLKLIVVPKTLSFDWSMDAISKVESVLDSRFISSAFLYFMGLKIIGNLVLKLKNRDQTFPTLLFLLGLLSTPHIISSNLFSYVGFVAAERILYLNTVAYCILVGFAIETIREKFPSYSVIVLSAAIVCISLFCYKTIQRVEDWRSEESLFKSALGVNPTKAHLNLGYVYTMQRKYDLAKYHYQQALRRKGNLADAWYNLGVLTSKSSNSTQEAIQYYRNALESRSNFAAAHLNLALLLYESGFSQQAFSHLEKCLLNSGESLKSYRNHQRTQATCAYNKGRFHQKTGKLDEAIESFKLALLIGGINYEHGSSVLNSIGTCYNEIGDFASAEKYLELAIAEDNVNSFLIMAHLKIRQNKSYEAHNLLEKVITMAPESITVLQNIASAEFQMKNYNRSLIHYRKALTINPNHIESLHGIANILQETDNYKEAERFFKRIVDLQPDSFSAHTNYGAILHLNQKYESALKAYDMSLVLNKDDDVARENREKLFRILKRKNNL